MAIYITHDRGVIPRYRTLFITNFRRKDKSHDRVKNYPHFAPHILDIF